MTLIPFPPAAGVPFVFPPPRSQGRSVGSGGDGGVRAARPDGRLPARPAPPPGAGLSPRRVPPAVVRHGGPVRRRDAPLLTAVAHPQSPFRLFSCNWFGRMGRGLCRGSFRRGLEVSRNQAVETPRPDVVWVKNHFVFCARTFFPSPSHLITCKSDY